MPRKPPPLTSKSIHRSASKTPSTQTLPIRHRAMYLDIHEPKEVLRASLVTARQQMSEAYGKEFTAVALSADCNGVDQLRHRLYRLRVRENLLRRAVHRLDPRFRRDSLRFLPILRVKRRTRTNRACRCSSAPFPRSRCFPARLWAWRAR